MYDDLKKLVYPSRLKIVLSFCLAVIWLIIVFSFSSSLSNFVFGDKGDLDRLLAITVNVLVFTLLLYPLACGLEFVYEGAVKKTKSTKFTALAAALFIVVLNPVSFFLLSYLSQGIIRDYMTEPCGVEITAFTDINTALKSGLVNGDVIIGAEGERVDTVAILLHVLADKKVGDNVTIQTVKGNYNLTLIEHPQKHIPILGIQGQERRCSKYF